MGTVINVLKENKSQSLVDLLCAQIRREIISGILASDTEISIIDLQKDYAGAAQDIYQALKLLSKEGMICSLTPEQFRVVKLPETDIINLIELRSEIECKALECSLSKGNIHWLGGVIAAQQNLLDTLSLAEGNFDCYASSLEESNKLFHQSLLGACDLEELHHQQHKLYQQSLRYRVNKLKDTRQNLSKIADILNQLVTAISARDNHKAQQLLSKFILFS